MNCNSEIVRPIEEKDLDAALKLRNDNHQWFFQGTVSLETHLKWYSEYDRSRVDFYVIELNGAVIGTLSFTLRDDGIEIGNLTLDPAHRKQGIMHRAIKSLMKPGVEYYGRVLTHNESSRRVFERLGCKVLLQPS